MLSRGVVAFCACALLGGLCFSLRLSGQHTREQLGGNFPPEDNFSVTSEVTYTTGAHGPLKADVYIPVGTGPFPGIVFIHGGGWTHGDRHQMIALIKALAEDGYVGFTIDYDLGKGTFPDSLHESRDAVRFFRKHAAEYHLDPARIAVAGSSAGGELAALVALSQGDPASRVQAAIILNGALDLTPAPDPKSPEPNAVETYLGGACQTRIEACNLASPQYQVHAGAPPFYVGHGTMDQSVPFTQAVAFTTALKSANVPVEFFQAQGVKHTFWVDPRYFHENLDRIKAFLKLQLSRRP